MTSGGYVPIATGLTLLSGTIPEVVDGVQELKLKGKAVQVEHHLFDELWNSGDRVMP